MNYEALDKYGINLSAATLENSEYVKSLGKSWNQLSDNEKMMAAYNEIVRQGGVAQGLAKEEAGSFASQLKLLKENLSDTFGVIGSTVLPYLEPLIAKIQEVCGKIQAWVQEHPKLTAAIVLFVATIGLLLVTLGPILMIVGTCIVAFASLGMASAALGIGIGALCAPILAVIAALLLIGAIVALVIVYWDELKAWGQQTWTAIKDGWNNSMKACKEEAIMIWENIKNFLSLCWQGICNVAEQIWNDTGAKIGKAVQDIIDFVSKLPGKIGTFLSETWNKAVEWASNMKQKAVEAGREFVNNAIQWIQQLPGKIWSFLSQVVQKVAEWASDMGRKGLEGAKNLVEKAVQGIKDLPSKLGRFVSEALSSISKKLSEFKPSWSIPKPKLPKIDISLGSKSIGGISVPYPKFSVSWNAKGGIFRKPTIIPTLAGMQGVGEAGAEAILPLDRIQGYFDNAMRNTFGENGVGGDNINITVNAEVSNDIDIRTLANQIANHVERSRRW